MANMELKPSKADLMRKGISNTFWTIAGTVGTWKAYEGIRWTLDTFGKYDIEEPLLVAGFGILGIAAGITAGINSCGIISCFYRNKRTDTISKDESKIVKTEYGFPASKNTEEFRFNRVIDAKVSQGTVQRMLGTGDVTLEVLTYTNADSDKRKWTIPHLENPEKAKEDILKDLPDYEGLEVKVK